MDAHQGFLEGVLGIQRVLQDPVDARVEQPEIRAHEAAEGIAIPLLGS
jgi:hypothetical protein